MGSRGGGREKRRKAVEREREKKASQNAATGRVAQFQSAPTNEIKKILLAPKGSKTDEEVKWKKKKECVSSAEEETKEHNKNTSLDTR